MGWMKIRSAAAYADVSPRTMRRLLKQGLRYSQLPSGRVLIKQSWIDEYLSQFESSQDEVREVVDEVIKKFTS